MDTKTTKTTETTETTETIGEKPHQRFDRGRRLTRNA